MSLNELQASVESIFAWKAILWCFYPMATLLLIEFLARGIDDDHGGGEMIPALQDVQN